jgi:signal transduction histidine kinase
LEAVPADHRVDTVGYLVALVTLPLWLGWTVRALTAAQLARFERLLGVTIQPRRAPGGFWLWRFWWAATTWRQLGYHLLAPVTGVAGAALAIGCWGGLLALIGRSPAVPTAVVAVLALGCVPWLVPAVAGLDTTLARRLLGPSRREELVARVESLTRSRSEIVEATDAQRRRIERDLHDGAQQRLVSLAMNLGMARATLTDLPEPARRVIADAHDEAKQALAELRDLVRGLHPAVLTDRGLDAALSGLAARSPVPVRLRVDVAQRCAPTVEAVAYFVVSEALTNVAKHAAATSAEVTVARVAGRLRIVVTDDGRGGAVLTPCAAAEGNEAGGSEAGGGEAGGNGAGGSGLRGLVQRLATVDGVLTIASPTGGPTTLTAELPCAS